MSSIECLPIVLGMNDSGSLLCYFGHHKCASSWFYAILRSVCLELGRQMLSQEEVPGDEVDLISHCRQNGISFLVLRFVELGLVRRLPEDFRGFHVIRDPRDILVSAYFSHRFSHPTNVWPELKKMRSELEKLSEEDGLIWEFEFLEHVFAVMEKWDYGDPRVLELKMEEVTVHPYSHILRIFDHLGLLNKGEYRDPEKLVYFLKSAVNKVMSRLDFVSPKRRLFTGRIPAERLLGITFQQRFEKLSGGRAQGQENVNQHYRKGVAGDWKNHFTPKVTEKFKQRYNRVLVATGYENDDKW